MTNFESLVLGVVQGVTEFLPISSTAHLRIVPALLHWDDPGAAYTAVLQLGSLVAVIGYFLPELMKMLSAGLKALTDRSQPPSRPARELGYLVVGTIPAVVAGVLFRHAIEGSFRSLWVIASAMIVVALMLAVVEKKAAHVRAFDELTLRDALIIGCAQAFAVIPGVSRSGSTLMAAMALGFRREAAARFSFLLSVPIVAAAGVFEMPKVMHAHDLHGSTMAIGLLAAAVAGYASIAWLLRFLRARSTVPFIIYRVALGLVLIALLATGRL
ncbi:MAG TPA: undecaprenyl-diphosphatase UppP [Polyangia bacterium]|nr:undecaprenyl-diphosphatase UppP [Polyangia bacterium]